jgi:hypothetical protein
VAYAQIAITCLVALSVFSQSGHPSSGAACGCDSPDAAARGLERLAARDWRQIDRAALEADWPQVRSCQGASGPGLEGIVESIGRCCDTCELCGGVAVDERPSPGGLRIVDLWLCPKPLPSQEAALRRLTRAATSSKPDITATSVSRTDERVIEGYSWVAGGEWFTLRTDAIRTGETWIGNVKLGRCHSEAVTDTWRVGGDTTVRVIRAGVERGNESALEFEYASICLFEDRACHATELDRLWPTLRSVASRHNVTAIEITAENCVGSSLSFRLDRSPEGWWRGLWSPRVN